MLLNVIEAIITLGVLELLQPVSGSCDIEPAAKHIGSKTAFKVRPISLNESDHLIFGQKDIRHILFLPERGVLDFQQ